MAYGYIWPVQLRFHVTLRYAVTQKKNPLRVKYNKTRVH